jgi:drug/metabolite transporter (DMT)-like permease
VTSITESLPDSRDASRRATAARSRGVGVAMLILASVMWSLSGVAVKTVHMDAIGFALWRSVAAGLAMAAMLPFSRGRLPHAGWMMLVIVLHAAVVTLLITAMTLSTAAAGIILQYTGPVYCALFAWMFQRRAISRRTAVALVIAMVGVAIMLIGGMKGVDILGPITGAISGVAFGALILSLEILNRSDSDEPVNPILIVTLNNLGTAVILLPIAIVMHQLGATPKQFAIVSATGVIQLALPYLLFVLALRRVGPVEASLLILLEPVLNPVWVWLAVGERPDAATFIGGAAILTAMVIEATKPASSSMRAIPAARDLKINTTAPTSPTVTSSRAD